MCRAVIASSLFFWAYSELTPQLCNQTLKMNYSHVSGAQDVLTLNPRQMARSIIFYALLGVTLFLGAAMVSAAVLPSDPTTQWTALPYPPGTISDYIEDQQTGSSESDIVGTNDLPAVYTTFIPGTSPTNGTIGYRLRVGRDDGPTGFDGVALVGIEVNRTGRLSIFAAVDNSGSPDRIRIFRAGSSANVSPSTTSIDSGNPIFSYAESATNYNWQPVSATSDPAVLTSTNPTPLNIDGSTGSGDQTDQFVSFFVPFADIVSAFQNVGITNITTNSTFRYILGTATQPNAINQDINGINGQINSSVSYTNLNIFTLPITPTGITPSNSPPVAVNDTTNTVEDVTVTIAVLRNDSDPDGNPLTITSATATNGTVVISGTNLVFIPATNFNGTATIGYTISDGNGGTASAVVTVTVSAVNDAPIAVNDSANTTEDVAVTIPVLVNDSDPDGNPLTITSATATNGTVVISGTNLVFTPATNFNGTATIGYTISDGNGGTASAVVTVIVGAQADVAIFKSGSTNVLAGSSVTYTITATNSGPSAAFDVVVIDNLPTNLVFQSASSGGTFSNGVVIWPAIVLLKNASTNYTITADAPTGGFYTNVASSSSSTPDPNPFNNNGTATNSRVQTQVQSAQFFVLVGTNKFNPQTGLFEQNVKVTNVSGVTIPAFRIYVDGLRTGVSLYNATGTNNGRPYVQYNSPLNPAQGVTIVLKFYNPDRRAFTNSIEVQSIAPSTTGTNAAAGVAIDRWFVDSRISGEPRYVIEFTSSVGRIYTINYSDDNMLTWKIATPSITAGSNRTQWYDDGPPETDSKPLINGSRFYRVVIAPQNP